MSRNFEGTPNRDFKPSPNRDRIAKGGMERSDTYFVAGERNADIELSFGLNALFPYPNYAATDQIFQHATFGSVPFDTLTQALATPIVVGDIFRVTLIVEGITELYNPAEPVDLSQQTWDNLGTPRTSYVLRRNSLCGVSIFGFEFDGLNDALASEPLIGEGLVQDFTSGQLLLLNPTQGIGVTGIIRWRKQIVATMRATQSSPSGYGIGNGARAQSVTAKYVFEGDEDHIITLARVGRRNANAYNTASSLVPGRNIVHTPEFTSPPAPQVLPSATMFIGQIIGWEKTAFTNFLPVQYVDLIPPATV